MCAPLSRERILKCDGEERRHAVAIESCVDGPLEPAVERLAQWRLHRPLERLGGVLRDECPRTGARVSEPLAFELAIGLQHRVRVDREVFDDLASRRELVTGTHDAVLDRMPDLLHELEIRRNAAARIETESHQRHFTMTLVI